MRLISVNVGLPREVNWNGKLVTTSIYKYPVEGEVLVEGENIVGDRQSDLRVHGGPDKAVYAYPIEHYQPWREELQLGELPWGSFGENLSVEGLLEDQVFIGDQYRIGNVILAVSEPRFPCFKLENKLERRIIKPMTLNGRSGFYFSIVQVGTFAAGAPIELLHREERSMSVREISALVADHSDLEALRRASALSTLAKGLRASFRRKLTNATKAR